MHVFLVSGVRSFSHSAYVKSEVKDGGHGRPKSINSFL